MIRFLQLLRCCARTCSRCPCLLSHVSKKVLRHEHDEMKQETPTTSRLSWLLLETLVFPPRLADLPTCGLACLLACILCLPRFLSPCPLILLAGTMSQDYLFQEELHLSPFQGNHLVATARHLHEAITTNYRPPTATPPPPTPKIH